MQDELGQIKFTEEDGCIRMEVTGDKLKEMFSKCCVQVAGSAKEGKSDCCSVDEADGCIRIEVSGKSVKAMIACCCAPTSKTDSGTETDCCGSGEKAGS